MPRIRTRVMGAGCRPATERSEKQLRAATSPYQTENIMTGQASPLAPLDGIFHRAVLPARLTHVLDPPVPESAGRYHRPGEPALYMSPYLDWARIAVSGYMREDGLPRLIVPLRVTGARVLDQRDARAMSKAQLDPTSSAHPWRPVLKEGGSPPSWALSDKARALGANGLTDISRHIRGGWHLVLFRWNEDDSPRVRVSGPPVEVQPTLTGPKWG